MKKDLIQELTWRGMLHDTMPGIEQQLSKEITSAYIGFDPTASSLHIGNLATIMLLKQLQLCGHKPIALVGGATGMVGDPSGKSQERNLLDEKTLRKNQKGIRSQLKKFLDFDCGHNSAEIVNNYDWFKEFGFLSFLRDVGKHLTINYMMAKDSVKNRLETGLSFTEFSYQLLQAYDFYYLYKNHNVKLQMGGSDQWGNITSGIELIRRMGGGIAYVLTCPLVTKANGSKFGKSEEGNVWLNPEMTSPYKFYQFWLNCTDEDSNHLIKIFSLRDRQEIESLIADHKKVPHLRVLQKAMAEELTERIHGKAELNMAIYSSKVLFGKKVTEELKTISSKAILSVFDKQSQVIISKDKLQNATDVSDLLSGITENLVFSSKGEAKRMIKGGGISINKEKITSAEQAVNFELLQGKFLLIQKGKKNHYLIIIE